MGGVLDSGLPYPDPEDMIAGGADAIKDLAEAIDLYRGSTEPAHNPGRIWIKTS